jgi:DNA adenine methylase
MSRKNDFVFLDPPYVEDHKYHFSYNKKEVLDNKFIDGLYKEVKKLDRRGVQWLMTQADTPMIRKVFKEYDISEMHVYRAGRNAYAIELIIRNYID